MLSLQTSPMLGMVLTETGRSPILGMALSFACLPGAQAGDWLRALDIVAQTKEQSVFRVP